MSNALSGNGAPAGYIALPSPPEPPDVVLLPWVAPCSIVLLDLVDALYPLDFYARHLFIGILTSEGKAHHIVGESTETINAPIGALVTLPAKSRALLHLASLIGNEEGNDKRVPEVFFVPNADRTGGTIHLNPAPILLTEIDAVITRRREDAAAAIAATTAATPAATTVVATQNATSPTSPPVAEPPTAAPAQAGSEAMVSGPIVAQSPQ